MKATNIMNKYYAIKSPDGYYVVYTFSDSAEWSIRVYRNQYNNKTWEQFLAEGYTCVPVEVKEVQK